jgi:hypothetical protein
MNPKDLIGWAIGPVAGIAIAAVLVGGLTFILTWAVYTIVGAVSLWLVLKAVDWWRNRPSSVDEVEPENVREPADVA